MFHLGLVGLIGLAFGLLAVYVISTLIYNVFFHPLRKFPGPVINHASKIPWARWLIRGDQPYKIHELHKRYGPIVRTAPDEVSFIGQGAWKDIYGHRIGTVSNIPEIPKYEPFYKPIDRPYSVVNAPRDLHAVLRRGLAHGFSEKSMRDQEGIIGYYVDLLISRLREQAAGGDAINLVQWYNFITFDVIGDLSVGSSFGCLERSEYHPWVKLFEKLPQQNSIRLALVALGAEPIFRKIIPYINKSRTQHDVLTKEWLLKRMELKAERPDLIEGLLNKEGLGYGFKEIYGTATTLLIAGSETTATTLSGVTFFLLTHPDLLAKVTEEVRSSFKSEDEITLVSVQKLSFMLACLNETLRMYPPVSIGMPRYVPEGGVHLQGHFIPEKTIVNVPHYAINHSPVHWKEPDSFRPERFLGDPEFATDHLETLQPFSFGPRNCIGRNLAYAEMRLILGRILYNFDMRLSPECTGWFERQKSHMLWSKPALNVFLTPAKAAV